MKLDLDIETKCTETYTGTITGKDIKEKFDLPIDAEVWFCVPGGGDWSNENVSIDVDYPIHVKWEKVTYE